MKKPFKVGDRVAAYCTGKRYTGTVATDVNVYRKPNTLWVELDDRNYAAGFLVHEKQCRRLKPRPKNVKITIQALKEAWKAEGFQEFCKALGLTPNDE